MRKKRYSIELSFIYLTAVFLVVSAAHLFYQYNARPVYGEQSLYPKLYAATGETADPIIREKKTVYFTFDDGPSHNTEIILDMLQEEGARATFFVTGQQADNPATGALLRRMLNEGHTIGLHTYSHNFTEIYHSADAYLKDLDRLRSYIEEETGYNPAIYRFPGGSATSNASKEVIRQIIEELSRRGYVYYDWNSVSGDDTATVLPAHILAENILKGGQGKEPVIVLCHDNATPETTPEAVRLAIQEFRTQGYVFDSLSPSVEPIQLVSVEE